MQYLLDTDICIFFLQGKFKIREKIKSVGISNCFLSEINIAELKYGAANSDNKQKHYKEIETMEELFTILPIYNSLDKYATEKTRLRKLGILLPDFDLLIASTAISNDLVLVTNNEKHFQRFTELRIENWTKISS